jgi:phage-related minor tail protein
MIDDVDKPISSALDSADELSSKLDVLEERSKNLASSANGFASAMTRAFTQATVGGKQFDDVLKSLALRMSSLVLAQAFKPIATGIASALTSGLTSLFGGLFGTSFVDGRAASSRSRPAA